VGFGDLLSQRQGERYAALRDRMAGGSPAPRAADPDGFVTPEECATDMAITVDEVLQLARIGLLEYRVADGIIGRCRLLIRPAIVSRG
jgi:hypothetical protein